MAANDNEKVFFKDLTRQRKTKICRVKMSSCILCKQNIATAQYPKHLPKFNSKYIVAYQKY